MSIFDKEKHNINPTKRAPLQREAPFPLKGPAILPDKFNVDFAPSTGFLGGPSAKRKGYHLAMWSLLASVIDGLMILSFSSLFLVLLSVILNAPLSTILETLFLGQALLFTAIQLYVFCGFIYLITLRSLFGFSLGEWACDLRLGQPQERLQNIYILRVVLRGGIILGSGLITLPLLSLLLGKDLSGKISGLKLFSLK